MSTTVVFEDNAILGAVSLLPHTECLQPAVNSITIWTFLVLVLTLSVLCIHKWYEWSTPLQTLPQVFSLPLIGNLTLLTNLPHHAVTKMVTVYGKIFRLNAGGDRTFVILNDIYLVREVMKKFSTALSGKPQSTTTKLTNAGAQRDMGKRWAKRRQITMSAFKSLFKDCPDQIHDICEEELTELVKTLKRRPEGGHEPTQDITYFVARTMWRMVYGQGKCPDDATCDQLKMFSTKIDDYTQNSGPFSVLDRFPWLKKLVASSMNRYRNAVKFMNDFCDSCEKKRRFHANLGGRDDLMTFMKRGADNITLEDKQRLGLTTDLLYQGVADLIRAGTESPSLLVLWACLMLAKRPDVQEKMVKELEFYNTGSDVSVVCDASMTHMPYTHAVVYETIRYCSIVPFLKRRCLSDIIVGGHKLPAGTTIVINNDAISHDKDRWDCPQSFNPERFMTENGTFNATKLETFLPFGIGKRRCMGEEIGKLLPVASIATLVLNFKISVTGPVDLTPSFGITLTPQKHNFKFSSRNYQPADVL